MIKNLLLCSAAIVIIVLFEALAQKAIAIELSDSEISTYDTKSTALEIMTQIDSRFEGKTNSMLNQVVLIEKNNERSQRQIKVINKVYKDVRKSITQITQPTRIKGTGFLTFDWNQMSKENESWIYLPDLRKVTRLSTSNRADYFLGTDFSYGDLEGLEVQDFNYEFDNPENLYSTDKAGLVKIIATPKTNSTENIIAKYGYQGITYWVNVNHHLVVKAKYQLQDNGWIKYYKASKLKDFDGVWFPVQEQMILTQHNQKIHTTVITILKVEINPDIHDELFTPHGLEQGSF